MIPKRVTLKNFLSFGEEEQVFDFTENEALWILTGPNGVGKSAVFDAITYCLFTEHRGGKSDHTELIRHGANGFRIRFEFAFAGTDYRITRGRTRTSAQPTQSVESWADGAWTAIPNVNGVTETKAWIRDVLGLRFESFTASVLLRQGQSDVIIEATGKDRLEVLKRIIDVERFEKLSTRIADAMKEHGGTLKQLQQRRGNATEVTPEEVEQAKASLAEAELERAAAQDAVIAAAKAVDQAKQYAKLDAERQELDAKLREVDDRAKQKKQIEEDHARLTMLSEVVPSLVKIAAARSRLAVAEEKHTADSAALATANAKRESGQVALQTAREKIVQHKAAKEEHDREANRLGNEVTRDAKFLATAEQVETLKADLEHFPADLDANLQAARDLFKTADDKTTDATAAKADVESRLKQLKKQQEEFESVGATCSMCRQPVTKEHAAEERAKLKRDATDAKKKLDAADLALTTAKHEKKSATDEVKSLEKDENDRNLAVAALTIHEKTLADIGLHSDSTKLAAELEAKRALTKQHQEQSAAEAKQEKDAIDESKRLEAADKTLTDECRIIGDRVQTHVGEIAATRSERDTLLSQLDSEWHSTVDVDALAAEQAKLAASGIAARFAALASDSEHQQTWKVRRETIRTELADLPAASLPDAETAATLASSRSRDANANRDSARAALDGLEIAVAAFQKLLEELAASELAFDRHRKLNVWLGKDGLLRELVREAEREIVQHAQDTLRNLSSGDLEIELQGPSDGKDEALILLVRRAGDPEPIPVRFLSGSQKFRVAVAIAVAIGKFAAGPAAARPLESVIIDEGFGSLDKDGLAAMREELDNLKNSQALKRVILVSHQEEFTKSFPIGYTLSPGEQGTIATRFRNDG